MRKETFLSLAAFAMDGCAGMAGLGVPLLAMAIGASYGDLGAIGATGSVAYSVSCFASGWVADRVGYRRMLTLASAGTVLVYCSYLAVDRIWQLYAIAFAGGVLNSCFWPPLQAWLGQGRDRRGLLRAVGRFNVAWSLGFLVGPAVAGGLYTRGPGLVFGTGAVVVGAVLLALLLARVREAQATDIAPDRSALAASRRFLPVAWVANFATFFANGTVRALFPKYATDLGIPPEPLGWLIAAIGLTQAAAFLLVSRTDRWQFRLGPLAAAQVLAVAGLLALVLGASPAAFAAGLLLQGTLVAVTFTSSVFYSLHAEGPGGRRTGIHEGIVGSGFLVGPLAGGFAAEYVAPRAPYLLAAAVVLAALGLQAYLLRRGALREPVPAAIGAAG